MNWRFFIFRFRLRSFSFVTNDWDRTTNAVRIAGVTFFTAANRNVIGYVAVGVYSASSRARIDAFVVDAVLIPRTIGIKDALRPAGAVRIADVISRTNAIDGAVLFLALGICSARIRIAWTRWLNNVRFY